MFRDSKRTMNLMQAVPVVVMIIFIVVLTYTLVLYNHEVDAAKKGFIEIGSKLTSQSANGMEMWLQDQVRMTGIIADHPVLVKVCKTPRDKLNYLEAQEILEGLNTRYPYYEAMPIVLYSSESKYINTKNGVVRVDDGEFLIDSVGDNLVGKGGYDLSYVKQIAAGKSYYISEIYPSINSGEPIIAISHPIKDGDELIGATVVAPKIDYFSSRFVNTVEFGETGYMFIVDSRGLTVSHPDPQNIMKPYEQQGIEERRIINRVLMGQTFFQDNYRRTDKSYYVKRVSLDTDHQPYEWFMVFTMENHEVFKNADKLLQISISMLIGGSLLIALILSMYTRSFESKVRELQALELSRKLEVEVAARTSKLAEMAVRDGLTKLYNHEATYKALGVAVGGARASLQPLSMIMLDLDNFKVLNDTYGHPFGDEVLKQTATVIRDAVRSTDIVGRYGGEEFLVILPGAPKQSAVNTAKRISDGLKVLEFSNNVTITASMGVTTWLGDDVDEFVSRADKLLYQAKNKGRDRIESNLDE